MDHFCWKGLLVCIVNHQFSFKKLHHSCLRQTLVRSKRRDIQLHLVTLLILGLQGLSGSIQALHQPQSMRCAKPPLTYLNMYSQVVHNVCIVHQLGKRLGVQLCHPLPFRTFMIPTSFNQCILQLLGKISELVGAGEETVGKANILFKLLHSDVNVYRWSFNDIPIAKR